MEDSSSFFDHTPKTKPVEGYPPEFKKNALRMLCTSLGSASSQSQLEVLPLSVSRSIRFPGVNRMVTLLS